MSYNFKLRLNKCSFRNGNIYLRRDPIIVYLTTLGKYKNMIP